MSNRDDIKSWDLETHLIKPGQGAPKMVCLTTADHNRPDGNGQIYLREEGLDRITDMLKHKQRQVGHHIFYDLGVAAAEKPELLYEIFQCLDAGVIEDTKIRQMMIDNAEGKLKFIWNEERNQFEKQAYYLFILVRRHLHKNIQHKKEGGDIWRLRYNELDGVPLSQWPKEAIDYAIDDSIDTLGVRDCQEDIVRPEGIPGETSQTQAAWALHLLGLWGVRTDPDRVAKLRHEINLDYKNEVEKCQQFGLRRTNVKASRDMKKIRAEIERWYKDADREMKFTPKGAIATDREQLTTTDHPGLHAVAESVRLGKLLTTYVPVLERGISVPITPNYNPIIETFRTSCSDPNLQNPPRKGGVRDCFIPREGNVFAFCDYDTLEMLTLAQVCLDLFGYSEIAEAAKAGQDFHLAMAADMLEIPYSQAHALHEANDPNIGEARQGCKIANYGFAGGMGWRTFIEYAKGFGQTIEPSLAQKLHGGFRKKWREMNDYFSHCSFLCDGGRAERVEFVRSGLVRGLVPYTAVCNGFFQHLAAMGAKEALYRVVKECYIDAGSPLYGCRPWLFAHDEIGMEIPYAALGPIRAHEAAMRLQEVMIEAMKFWCPDVPIGATVNMCRRWLKGAKPVKIRGLLTPSRKDGKQWVADV